MRGESPQTPETGRRGQDYSIRRSDCKGCRGFRGPATVRGDPEVPPGPLPAAAWGQTLTLGRQPPHGFLLHPSLSARRFSSKLPGTFRSLRIRRELSAGAGDWLPGQCALWLVGADWRCWAQAQLWLATAHALEFCAGAQVYKRCWRAEVQERVGLALPDFFFTLCGKDKIFPWVWGVSGSYLH